VVKPGKIIGEYTGAGYPKNNPKFLEEAAKLLERRKGDLERYKQYVREWSAKLRAGVKP